MSAKTSTSLQFNHIIWEVFPFSESCLLLQAKVPLERIQETAQLLGQVLSLDIKDLVPAYESIAVFTNSSLEGLKGQLEDSNVNARTKAAPAKQLRLPVCYELGLDLEVVAEHNQLTKGEVIERHLAGTYEAALIGFTPGFIYMDGLDPFLACPRRNNPRIKVEEGSVGIGGSQTGIYSLQSPGGWNIIGKTPYTLFDANQEPPMRVEVGTKVQFYRITMEEFEQWER